MLDIFDEYVDFEFCTFSAFEVFAIVVEGAVELMRLKNTREISWRKASRCLYVKWYCEENEFFSKQIFLAGKKVFYYCMICMNNHMGSDHVKIDSLFFIFCSHTLRWRGEAIMCDTGVFRINHNNMSFLNYCLTFPSLLFDLENCLQFIKDEWERERLGSLECVRRICWHSFHQKWESPYIFFSLISCRSWKFWTSRVADMTTNVMENNNLPLKGEPDSSMASNGKFMLS